MKVYAVFGLRVRSLQEAKDLIERTTKTQPRERDNFENGTYYAFSALSGESTKVIDNASIHEIGTYNVAEADGWRFVAVFSGGPADSKMLIALNTTSKLIIPLTTATY